MISVNILCLKPVRSPMHQITINFISNYCIHHPVRCLVILVFVVSLLGNIYFLVWLRENISRVEITIDPNNRYFLEQNKLKGTHNTVPQNLSDPERFTVIVNSHKRNTLLLRSLQEFKGLRSVQKVIVVRADEDPPPIWLEFLDIGVPIETTVTFNSLNSRFLPPDNITTEAVFSVDDDLCLSNNDIEFAFTVWKSFKDRLVGFSYRTAFWDETSKRWTYTWEEVAGPSMVLTNAAFFHKKYLDLYTKEMFPEIKIIIDKITNCEDIAMNFLVAHKTRKPPVPVLHAADLHCDMTLPGISRNVDHLSYRSACINVFTRIYGYMPLLESDIRVIRA